jgi:1-acyl-sn-glycerol-3-phosphate acyltransferase
MARHRRNQVRNSHLDTCGVVRERTTVANNESSADLVPDKEMASDDEREPGDARRALLRRLYLPWAWLVFFPFLVGSTLFWGIAAVLCSLLSPRLGFHCGTVWSWCLCRANLTSVRIRGRHHARPRQSYVIMSNHQSHFDILAFYGHWGRQFRWVMKHELRKVPGLGWGCAAIGHIFIDRSDRARAVASLEAAKGRLANGVSVMFFPEGTRSANGRMGELKKGGFMMALEMGLPILPVSISGSRHVLPSKALWLLPGRIEITVHEPVDVSGYSLERRERLMHDVASAIRSGLSPWEQGPTRSA